MAEAAARSRDRLIVALDVPDVAQAETLVARLGESVGFYKIGHQLQFTGGLALARDLARDGRSVFLDVKLHDIPNTVSHGIAAIAGLGMRFATVHAYPQTMRAAVEAARGSTLQILAVSVLTSMADEDLEAAGFRFTAEDLVLRRARQAAELGVHGLVCSAREARVIRAELGDALILVTPGIRPAGLDAGDQKRVMTPAEAMRAGADHLVVGRPIAQADDPRAAAQAVLQEITTAD
jgi:orotidine-5'-phosphate decarboxylase